jgi:hypothetical protein
LRPLLGCAALALASCSFVLQDVGMGAPPHTPPTCSDSYGYAIADLVVSGGATAGFVALVNCGGSEDCLGRVFTGIFAVLPIAVTWGLSAIYGLTRSGRCHDARLLWIEMQAAPPPPAIAPPPPPTGAPPPDAAPAPPPMK